MFSCSVCAGNMTWRVKSVQCCTCFEWVHLRCSQLSLFKFRTLGSSHFWSCPQCCVPICNTVTLSSDSSDLYISTVQSSPPLLMLYSRSPSSSNLLSPFCPFCIFSFAPSPPSLDFGCPSSPPASSPADFFSVLRWNAGGL